MCYTEKRFLKLTDAMEKEQESNQNRMQEIAALISEEEHSEGDVRMFMGKIRRYAAITELDEIVLNRLINRILIGEPKKIDGVRTQEVRIVYNFDGELLSKIIKKAEIRESPCFFVQKIKFITCQCCIVLIKGSIMHC